MEIIEEFQKAQNEQIQKIREREHAEKMEEKAVSKLEKMAEYTVEQNEELKKIQELSRKLKYYERGDYLTQIRDYWKNITNRMGKTPAKFIVTKSNVKSYLVEGIQISSSGIGTKYSSDARMNFDFSIEFLSLVLRERKEIEKSIKPTYKDFFNEICDKIEKEKINFSLLEKNRGTYKETALNTDKQVIVPSNGKTYLVDNSWQFSGIDGIRRPGDYYAKFRFSSSRELACLYELRKEITEYLENEFNSKQKEVKEWEKLLSILKEFNETYALISSL